MARQPFMPACIFITVTGSISCTSRCPGGHLPEDSMNVRTILCLCLFLPLLCGGASAYFISFTVPAELDAGDPLVVQGESNLPAGATVEVEIFRDVPNFQSKKVANLPADIQADGSWEVTFPTTGWVNGT